MFNKVFCTVASNKNLPHGQSIMKNHLQNWNAVRKSTKFSITETSFSSSSWSNFFSVSFETVNHFSFARRKAAKVPWNNLKMQKQPWDVFFRKKIPQNSQENTCARVSFFNKVSGLRPAPFFKKRLWHVCFPVNFAKFWRTPILQKPPDDCFRKWKWERSL